MAMRTEPKETSAPSIEIDEVDAVSIPLYELPTKTTYVENNLRPHPTQIRMYILLQSCTFRGHCID